MQTGECHCGGKVHLGCKTPKELDFFRGVFEDEDPEAKDQMSASFQDVCFKIFSGGEICLPVLKG